MNLSALFSAKDITAGRFLFVSVLPTYAAAVWLLTLVWAGAPGPLTFAAAWKTAADLKVGEALLIALLIALAALVAQPLQFPLMRALEGYGWPSCLAAPGRAYHRCRRRRMLSAPSTTAPSAQDMLRDLRRRRRYPPEDQVRPTLLGNVLAAAEDTAGLAYGFDAVTAWPRIYSVLNDTTRAVVDDRRTQLDAAARMVVICTATAVASALLLIHSGGWRWLTGALLLLAALSYVAAVQAALAFGESLHVAFDLHHFDLIDALHLPSPATMTAEKELNEKVCQLWRGEIPTLDITYRDPSSSE